MTPRALVALYAAASAVMWLYESVRYGYGAAAWACVIAEVVLVVFLWRGSRGAWVLSFIWTAGAFALGMSLAASAWGFEWLLCASLVGFQLILLLTPQVREFVRETAQHRALRARS
jgi:hypothetical protein